jgi:hypothetical protein
MSILSLACKELHQLFIIGERMKRGVNGIWNEAQQPTRKIWEIQSKENGEGSHWMLEFVAVIIVLRMLRVPSPNIECGVQVFVKLEIR